MQVARRVFAPILTVFAALCATAQTPRPSFEVASIKLNQSGDGHSGTDGWQARIVYTNLTLQALIAQAYGVSPFQVSGPTWLATEHFDIEAKYPAGTKRDVRQEMLRTLLQDRFQLAAHDDRKEMPGYALVVDKNGTKLKRSEGEDNDTQHSGGRIHRLTAKATTMATLAELLSRLMEQPVIDKTGLDGKYDFELRWSRDDVVAEPGAQNVPPSIFTAVQETLGLRLQAQKVPAAIVVVDHVERRPTEN